jgi:hypothetical protein
MAVPRPGGCIAAYRCGIRTGCRIVSFLSVEVVAEILKLWWFLKPITR